VWRHIIATAPSLGHARANACYPAHRIHALNHVGALKGPGFQLGISPKIALVSGERVL
jgi:hypothetical protein